MSERSEDDPYWETQERLQAEYSAWREEQICFATVYCPDPQDCGKPAVGKIDGTWLCDRHYAGWNWAGTLEPDEPVPPVMKCRTCGIPLVTTVDDVDNGPFDCTDCAEEWGA